MGLLNELKSKAVWEEFLAYKQAGGHLSKADAADLFAFMESREGAELCAAVSSPGFTFGLPRKTLLNKMGSGKKRTVYSFSRPENYVLKAMAYLLYRYDGLFSPNLYSFRRAFGVKKAVTRLTTAPGIDQMYGCKLDIHDYFNSINVALLLPMLANALQGDPALYAFLERLLTADAALVDGVPVAEKRGVMAGIPIAPFLANLYLADMDAHFAAAGVLYARYSDDILLFAPTQQEMEGHRACILEFLAGRGLSVNQAKAYCTVPGQRWEFLGVEYEGGQVDLSRATVDKIKGKIRRKARALYRWKMRKGASDEKAMAVFARVFNRKFFAGPGKSEFTWARWFFPLLTTHRGLGTVDRYMQQYMRYTATGRHSKANYRVRYQTLKACGYRSLVNAFYAFKTPGAVPAKGDDPLVGAK